MKIKYMLILFLLALFILVLCFIFTRNRLIYKQPPDYELFSKVIQDSIHGRLSKIPLESYSRLPVPKKVFRLWCTSNPAKTCGGRNITSNPLDITRKNLPDWEHIVYGDDDIDEFLRAHYKDDPRIVNAYNIINPKYGAARADMARLLIIYKMGGLYLDMKSCVTDKLPPIPPNKDMYVSGWSYSRPSQAHLFPNIGEFQNWYIYARPNAPILKDIIEIVVSNIYALHEEPFIEYNFLTIETETSAKSLVLSTTGPIAMTMIIKNSPHYDTVYVNNVINNSLSYSCGESANNISKNHYSLQTEPLVFPKLGALYIPKIIYCIAKPESKPVLDNIKKYCAGFEFKIYDDNMCLKFLLDYYGQDAVSIYNNFKSSENRYKFWSYCILYLFGGHYIDSKTVFNRPIANTFDATLSKTWYASLSDDNIIYDGLIVTPPRNPVFSNIIKHIYNNPDNENNIYDIAQKFCTHRLTYGNNKQSNGWTCVLLKETCTKTQCAITNNKNELVVKYDVYNVLY